MSETEVNKMLEVRLSGASHLFTNREKKQLIQFAGYHPFFLEMAAFHLWSFKVSHQGRDLNDAEIESALENIRGEAYEKFDNFRTRMTDERFRTLIAITQGPRIYATSMYQVNRLVQQGHVTKVESKVTGESSFRPFSTLYDDYLRGQVTQVDLWPLWSKTEKGLRRLIEERYARVSQRAKLTLQQYLETKHPKLYQKYLDYLKEKKRNDRYFAITSHPFDFTAPSDLWDFIYSEWSEFSDVFGPASNERQAQWQLKFEELRDARNPSAHNNYDKLNDTPKRKAEAICLEICELLAKVSILVA